MACGAITRVVERFVKAEKTIEVCELISTVESRSARSHKRRAFEQALRPFPVPADLTMPPTDFSKPLTCVRKTARPQYRCKIRD